MESFIGMIPGSAAADGDSEGTMKSSTKMNPGSAAANVDEPVMSEEKLRALLDFVNADVPTRKQYLALFPDEANFMGPADPEPASEPEGRPKRRASNDLGSMPPMKKAAVALGEGSEQAGPRPDSPVLTPIQGLSEPALQGHKIQQQVEFEQIFNAPVQHFSSGNAFRSWSPQKMLPPAAQQPAPQQEAFACSLQQQQQTFPQELQLQQTVLQQVTSSLGGDQHVYLQMDNMLQPGMLTCQQKTTWYAANAQEALAMQYQPMRQQGFQPLAGLYPPSMQQQIAWPQAVQQSVHPSKPASAKLQHAREAQASGQTRAQPGTPGFVEYRPAMAQVLGEQEAARKAKQERDCLGTWPQRKATDSKTLSPSRKQPAVGQDGPVVNLAMEMPVLLHHLQDKWPRMDTTERIKIALQSFKSCHDDNADIETLLNVWYKLCDRLTKRRAIWERSDAEAVAPGVIEDMRREKRERDELQADASAPAVSSTDGMADRSTRVMESQ